MAMDREVLVLCADGAAELLVVTLVTTAAWKRRWEKNDESRDGKVRDGGVVEGKRGGEKSKRQKMEEREQLDQYDQGLMFFSLA